MKRILLLLVAAAAGVCLAEAVRPATPAGAVAPGQVVGTYRLKLKGEVWLRSAQTPYRVERVGGAAVLVLSRAQPATSDPKLHVEIRLDPRDTGGLLDLATPTPAFSGDGFMVGDSMAVIDTGGPTYVNALTMTFFKDGTRVLGHWVSSFPAADGDAAAGGGAGVAFNGKRVGKPAFVSNVRVAPIWPAK